MADVDPEACKKCAKAVPWLSFWGNLALAVYKLAVGMIGGSAALVADAMHSFADVVGSTGIVIATKVSSREPDRRYPFGRGKAEFLGAVFVYTVLLLFAAGIIFASISSMFSDTLEAPHFVTLLGAGVSVVHNVLMYKYATCVGKRNNSPAILADAFENRADAVSSVACIFGIAGAMLIHPICDPIAALLVGFIILWNCQDQLREAAKGLMDSGMPEEDRVLVERLVSTHEGVQGVRFLRTRQTGARFWVDLGIEVFDDLALPEADAIAGAVQKDLKRRPQFHHITVYCVPVPRTDDVTDEPAPAVADEPPVEPENDDAADADADGDPEPQPA